METVLYVLTRPLSHVLFRLILNEGTRVKAGCATIVLVNVDDEEAVLEKVKSALTLLRDHDPRRHESMCMDVDEIAVVGFGVRTQYLPSMRTIVLRANFVGELQPDNIASVLVHEGCHARLIRRGILYRPWAKDRIERLCLRNQVWFLERVPDSKALAMITREDYENLVRER